MKEYIVHVPKHLETNQEEIVSFFGEPIIELIRCKDCKWGREISGNIECNADRNNPPEYHGYGWFCPLGRGKENDDFR